MHNIHMPQLMTHLCVLEKSIEYKLAVRDLLLKVENNTLEHFFDRLKSLGVPQYLKRADVCITRDIMGHPSKYVRQTGYAKANTPLPTFQKIRKMLYFAVNGKGKDKDSRHVKVFVTLSPAGSTQLARR